MPHDDPNAHSASVAVDVSADVAFAFLADGLNQSYWALGSLERRALGDNLFVGVSMFSGEQSYVRLRPNADLLLIDYFTGSDPSDLHHHVESRVLPGPEIGRSPSSCVITNTLWRTATSTAESWSLSYHLWKTEMGLIKARLERTS